MQEANADVADEMDPNAAEEDKVPDDDKTFAAMGVAKTIGTVSLARFRLGEFYIDRVQIVGSVDSNPDILNEIQQVIIPIISLTLESKAIGKCFLSYKSVRLTPCRPL